MGDFLTIDGHHLRLTWFVNLLSLGLLYGLILFLGLCLYLSLVDLGSFGLVNLGFLSLGLLLFSFLFHSIGLSLVLGLLCSLVCCLFLTHLQHISNRHTIARSDKPWQVDVERMMRKLRNKLTVLFGLRFLYRYAQRVGYLLCILIQRTVKVSVAHKDQRVGMLALEPLVHRQWRVGLVLYLLLRGFGRLLLVGRLLLHFLFHVGSELVKLIVLVGQMVLGMSEDGEHGIRMTHSLDGGTCGIAGVQHIVYDYRSELLWHLSVQIEFQVYALRLEVVLLGIVQRHVRTAGKDVPCRDARPSGNLIGERLCINSPASMVRDWYQYAVASSRHLPYPVRHHLRCLADACIVTVLEPVSQLTHFRIWSYGGERTFLFV